MEHARKEYGIWQIFLKYTTILPKKYKIANRGLVFFVS